MDDRKREVAEQIAALSKLLAMTPADDTVPLGEPMTDRSLPLAEWLDQARGAFMRLTLLVGKELDLQLQ